MLRSSSPNPEAPDPTPLNPDLEALLPGPLLPLLRQDLQKRAGALVLLPPACMGTLLLPLLLMPPVQVAAAVAIGTWLVPSTQLAAVTLLLLPVVTPAA